jgi:hypothetical protein
LQARALIAPLLVSASGVTHGIQSTKHKSWLWTGRWVLRSDLVWRGKVACIVVVSWQLILAMAAIPVLIQIPLMCVQCVHAPCKSLERSIVWIHKLRSFKQIMWSIQSSGTCTATTI